MARIILSALLTLILTLLSGCSDPQPPLNPTLLRADSLMEPAPDSALALLDTIDRTIFLPADSDLYALLLTQASVKNDRPLRSDTLIRRARRAYRLHGPHSLRRRAAFYSALSYYRRGHLPSAMSDALNAYELAKSESNPYWTAKAAELIADIFDAAYNYVQSEKFTREAITEYEKAGKIRNHRYSVCDLATTLSNQGLEDSAVYLLDSLRYIVNSEDPLDCPLLNYIDGATMPILLRQQRYDVLDSLMRSYQNSGSTESTFELSLYDYYLSSDTAADSYIDYNFDQFDLINNDYAIRALYARYEKDLSCGRYREAAIRADSLLDLQSQIAESLLQESTATIMSDYYETKASKQEARARSYAVFTAIVIFIAIILILAIAVVYRFRIRSKQAELESRLKDIFLLKKINSENSLKIDTLFKNRWNTLNILCTSYFDLEKPEDKRVALLNKIERELDNLRKPKTLKLIEKSLDEHYDGIMTSMRKECTFFKEEDFTFLALILAGFSSQVVCLLTNIKYKNFYLKKSRIIRRLQKSSLDSKEKYLEKLADTKRKTS